MSFCTIDDGAFPTFYRVHDRIARKEHRCCECDVRIQKGECYVYVSGKWDGDISTFKQHQRCAEVCRAFRDSSSEGCILFGGMTDHLDEEWEYRKTWNKRTRNAVASLLRHDKSFRKMIREGVAHRQGQAERWIKRSMG